MNSTGSIVRSRGRVQTLALTGLASAALLLFAACGSGGGGGGSFRVQGTIFGYDPFTGSFDASGQQGEAPLIPLNMCVVFEFTDSVAAGSANSQSIVVQELDTSVNPPAPGPLAAATFQVAGRRLIICPLITFTDTNATFGWGSQSAVKTYQILFQVPPSNSVVTSTGGKKILVNDRGPYFFRTSTQIFDQQPGAPTPTMRLLDPDTGAVLPTVNTPFEPVPDVEITFDEAVIPSTAVDPGGVGTSPNIHVELDTDANVATTNDRIVIPGIFSLTETNISATVLWESLLTEIPTEPVTGCLYVVTVDGTVQDLSGNDKVSETNDPAAKDVFTFTTLPGSSTSPVDPIVEPFDNQQNSDLTVTSAQWGTTFVGFLSPGIGGGAGTDGAFDPLDVGFQTNPPSGVTVNVPQRIVTINSESLLVPGTQRQYEFTLFRIPGNWTVNATGLFPLSVQCSGNVNISGTLNLNGAAGAVNVSGAVAPGAPGAAAFGGAAGGRGGSTTDSTGVDTFFPTKLGAPFGYGKLAYAAAAGANQGLSGRSTALNNASYTLTDANFAVNLDALATADLWIQPNVAGDDYRFERFHPAFKVESIAAGAVTVISDPADPRFRGELAQETINPWLEDDGNGAFRPPLLAELFDSYVIGELTGFPGGDLFDLDLDGAMDDPVHIQGGAGSESQSVMQTFLTLGRSGGGGGGGYLTAGADGADDPTVADGAGPTGGTGFVGGAGGAAAPSATVALRVDADTLQLSSPIFDDGTGNPDATFEGHLINPNINQGNTFRIASVDTVDTITIEPITTSGGAVIDLNNTTIAPGNTARVKPPYEVGGTGGGGAGVHCAGSSKTPAAHTGDPPLVDPGDGRLFQLPGNNVGLYDDDNADTNTQDGLEDTNPSGEAIFTLPRWVPGSSGGAGGGALRVVAAGNVDVGAAGQILAQGGEGGRSDAPGNASASGGGGGAGGSVFLGAGGTLSVALGGRISCAGGLGGAQGFGNQGGDGAPGRIRLENALGNLVPGNFTGAAIPPIAAEHLGLFPGGGDSIAQSLFQTIGALSPEYQQVVVDYTVRKNGVTIDATYTVLRDGTVDPSSTVTVAPFDLLVSAAPSNANGQADTANATPFADPTITPMQTYDGLTYVRFRVVLNDVTTPIVIGPDVYTDVRIDSISFNANSVKP